MNLSYLKTVRLSSSFLRLRIRLAFSISFASSGNFFELPIYFELTIFSFLDWDFLRGFSLCGGEILALLRIGGSISVGYFLDGIIMLEISQLQVDTADWLIERAVSLS
jgi:hypothetical protein